MFEHGMWNYRTTTDESPGDDTVAVYGPSAGPSVQVLLTSPLASVVPLAGANDCPAPLAGTNVTVTPGTPVPSVGMTRATICCGSAEAPRPV